MKKRKLYKIIAIFLALQTLYAGLLPTLTYALTSGPTAPEATSFEPVDTTDMVNLLTGDFTYNIPLLEVPGPAGGYPVNLSYHAGIHPNEDASWVGLGWTLNPGAINRTVNGYADDHENVKGVSRQYWEGGETTTSNVGLNISIYGGVSVSVGMSFSNDTYKGFGIGNSAGLGILGLNLSMTKKAYGGINYSGNLSVGGGLAGNLTFNSDRKKGERFKAYGSANLNLGLGTGASIRSDQEKPIFSVAGFTSNVNNGKSNNISYKTSSEGWASIFDFVPIGFSKSYTRYWIDESMDVFTNGSLYFPKDKKYYPYFNDHAFDTYDLLDIDLDIIDYPQGEKIIGGSFPDYDRYEVLAQGLAGNFRPYHYRQVLSRQNKIDESKDSNKEEVRNYSMEASDKPVEFRFVNGFSNRFEYEPPKFASTPSDPLAFSFDGEILTGIDGNEGYKNNHLAGKKHVKWYTNQEIVNSKARKEGFIDTKATGLSRNDNSQIGGFMITNESGVTYHYSLPVYSYGEFMKSENTEDYKETKGDMFNTLTKPGKYAYTWFLTAVTGPDYVDRNGNGFADIGDFGYWVEFDYGKWTDSYQWRNPSEGYYKDIDNKFQNYASGKKEIYYLDAIRTATHTALFIKEIREDGKGVSDRVNGKFEPYKANGCQWNFPVSVLGLRKVLLLKNEHLSLGEYNGLKANGNDYTYSFDDTYEFEKCVPCSNPRGECCHTIICEGTFAIDHFGQNILDISDFSDDNELPGLSLRAIEFETDNSLCYNTANSFDNEKLYKASPEIERAGKYTLKALHFLGKGEASLLPPTRFEYNNNPKYNKDAYDMWGYYKCDYVKTVNENIGRMTSLESSKSVDAWSLSTVQTNLGAVIDITYESDSYKRPALYKNSILNVIDIEVDEQEEYIKVIFAEKNIDLKQFTRLIQGSKLKFLLRKRIDFIDGCVCDDNGKFLLGGVWGNFYELVNYQIAESQIVQTGKNFLMVKIPELYNLLNEEQYGYYTASKCYNNSAEEITPRVKIMKPLLVAGNLIVRGDITSKGGGLRVKKLTLKSPVTGHENSTHYEYHGGTTSYEPVGMNKILFYFDYAKNTTWNIELERIKEAKNAYKKDLNKSFSRLLAISREMPGPGVMYENVTVRGQMQKGGKSYNLPSYTSYSFEVYNEGMVDVDSKIVRSDHSVNDTYQGIAYNAVKTGKVELKNYSTRIGALKRATVYNTATNKPISSMEYHYLHDGINTFQDNIEIYEPALEKKFNNQGVIEESFANARFVFIEEGKVDPYIKINRNDFYVPAKDEYHLLGVISKRESFPIIQTGQTNINYKTGITTTTRNLAFDFYSGEVTKTLSSDSYGNYFVSEKVPAYKQYPAMGLAINGGRNMLVQPALSKSYKVASASDLTPVGLVAANVQTWSDQVKVLDEETQPGIWRKQAAYQWDGDQALNADGTYPYQDFEDNTFSFNGFSENARWEKTGEITLYNIYSHALEAKDINGNYATSRMDPANTKVIATAANASYPEMAYAGAEYMAGSDVKEGGVNSGEGFASTARSHTGAYSLQVAFNSDGFNYTLTNEKADLDKKYKASVWVYLPGESETAEQVIDAQLFYRVNGQAFEVHPELQENKSKSWYLLELIIDAKGADKVYIGCRNRTSRSIYFDDFRVHPLNAAMISYVYDQQTNELTYILDHNNFYTHFEYDAAGRLVKTSRELLNFDYGEGKESFRQDHIISEVNYNYGKNNSN